MCIGMRLEVHLNLTFPPLLAWLPQPISCETILWHVDKTDGPHYPDNPVCAVVDFENPATTPGPQSCRSTATCTHYFKVSSFHLNSVLLGYMHLSLSVLTGECEVVVNYEVLGVRVIPVVRYHRP